MRRMTLRRLEVFVAVVEAGGFRACSDLMDISPAAVSHHINQLEEEIGYPLFVRHRGRVGSLTERGAKAYAEAKTLLGHADSFKGVLGGMNRKSTRRVAVFADPILDSHLAKHIAAFVSEHPSINVQLQRSHFEEMVDALGTGRADIAYFYSAGPVSSIPSELAWSEPLSICAKCDHPIFSRQRLTWRDLREFPFVAPPVGTHFRRSVDSVLRKHDLEDYNVALESGNANIAREAVIGGYAVSAVITRYLDEDLTRSGVRALPMFEGELALDVRRAVRGDLGLDRATLALTSYLNEAAPAKRPRHASQVSTGYLK
jgi:DNA-binding transcriptional LysR family regulator